MFKSRIVHGILVSGLISTVLGMYLPGPVTIYLAQNLKFLVPMKIGNTVKAEVEVIEINREKNRVKLKTTVVNEEGKIVIDGVATVMPPK